MSQLLVTESKSSPELLHQSSALFESSVESGCMACKVSALSGASFGLATIYRRSTFAEQQPLLMSSTLIGKSSIVSLPSFREFMGDPLVLCLMSLLSFCVFVYKFLMGFLLEQLVLVPGGLDLLGSCFVAMMVNRPCHEEQGDHGQRTREDLLEEQGKHQSSTTVFMRAR